MTRNYLSKLTLHVQAGKCVPNSNLGSSLSPFGINLVNFTKHINKITSIYSGYFIKIKICIISKNKYILKLGSPITVVLLKKLNVSVIKISELNKLLILKSLDFPRKTKKEILNIIIGTAKTLS